MINRNYKLSAALTSNIYLNEIFKNSFFFDIETSGLSHKYCRIISITCLYFTDGEFIINQMYCEHLPDEKEMLKCFRDIIKSKKFCITYNGNSFDISFIEAKISQYEINNFSFSQFMKIDLYRDAQKLKNKLNLPDIKLKTIESHYSIPRNDTFSGQDITVLYEAYTIEPKKEFTDIILQHNYEDVANLPSIFEKLLASTDVVILDSKMSARFNLSDIAIKKKVLTINMRTICSIKSDYLYPSLNYDLKYDAASQIINLSVPLYNYADSNMGSFYYLHSEDFSLSGYQNLEGIKKNLVPIKLNDEFYTDNIRLLSETVIKSVF